MTAIRAVATAVVVLWAVLIGLGITVEPNAVAALACAALVVAWGTSRAADVTATGSAPVVAAVAYARVLAGRAVPRQRDPGAAGHTRCRAPSGGVPAG